jgi:hypothetical protein
MEQMNNEANQAKVFQLCTELEDTRKRKRQVVGAFNDEIKRLQAEIKDLIHPEEAVDIDAEDLV